ncbi:hypothetical protein [Pseudomonas palleroniana]
MRFVLSLVSPPHYPSRNKLKRFTPAVDPILANFSFLKTALSYSNLRVGINHAPVDNPADPQKNQKQR